MRIFDEAQRNPILANAMTLTGKALPPEQRVGFSGQKAQDMLLAQDGHRLADFLGLVLVEIQDQDR
jgi:hypothetical protein